MTIPRKVWTGYTDKLRAINDKAADEMWAWLKTHSLDQVDEMLDYAFALVNKYGDASSALAAEMYDVTAELAGHFVPPAVPAATATKEEIAEAVVGTAKYGNPKLVASSVGRMTKLAGVDTVMQNALRDGAEWAWIPFGETCAFCITLASRGWQRASRKALRKGHAAHIHANCNCIYAVRLDSDTQVEGYDPEVYLSMYENSSAASADGKVKDLRRRLYAENSEAINAQKREAYRLRMERRRAQSEQ